MLRSFVPSLIALLLVASTAHAEHVAWSSCDTGIPPDETRGWSAFPRGDVFCPLVADPKREGSFASYLWTDKSVFGSRIGAIGIGDQFGLVRWNGARPGDGVELSVAANVYSQFDVDVTTFDLLNADYVLSIPLTMRWGPLSSRWRLYHQSSHLGEAFLAGSKVPEENFAFESAEAIVSFELAAMRLYAGGEYLLDVRPIAFDHHIAHGGVELHAPRTLAADGVLASVRPIAAVDVKAAEELEWSVGWSGRAGFEIGRAPRTEHRGQAWQLLFEFYDGPLPYGQFLNDRTRYYGVGLHLAP